jgi:hypothetical protein
VQRRSGEHRARCADANEDTALSIAGFVNDVDGNLATTQLSVTNGTLTVSLAGGATISGGANGSSTLTCPARRRRSMPRWRASSYQGSLDFAGADTLTVLSTDANGATDADAVAITVAAVGDGPLNNVPGAQTVNEDTVLSIGGISVSDADGNLATTQLAVTNGTLNVSLAGGASISAGANGSSTLTLSGTQAQINAALATLSYQGNANFNGGDTLTVLSTDGDWRHRRRLDQHHRFLDQRRPGQHRAGRARVNEDTRSRSPA